MLDFTQNLLCVSQSVSPLAFMIRMLVNTTGITIKTTPSYSVHLYSKPYPCCTDYPFISLKMTRLAVGDVGALRASALRKGQAPLETVGPSFQQRIPQPRWINS